ncbi:MAG: hypothetical protein KAW09_06615 [Thermoplasmata archaeon]|nr:hypothetical protein [Thermoplasmata archaeon]
MTSSVASFLKLSLREDTNLSSEVIKSLGEMGWEPVRGSYDFVYRWEADWEKDGKEVPQISDELKASVDVAFEGQEIRYVFKTFQSTEKDT